LVIITDGNNANRGQAGGDWTGADTLKLGIYLDKSVNGNVGALACAYDAGGTLVANGVAPGVVNVRAGEQVGPLMITVGTNLSPLCPRNGLGGRGGGGGT